MTTRYETDLVIVGAGGAGLRAAIAARDAGVRVMVVCKSLLGKAHTVMAEGGIAAALGTVDKHDDWRTHFRDTMAGGKYVNDWRAAELHAKEAPDEVYQLERWGALFDRTADGRILQRRFGGHRYPRLAHVGDRTGLELIRTLQDTAVAKSIDVLMEYIVTEIVVHDGAVAGVMGYSRQDGSPFAITAPAVIIASGGAGRLYQVHSNSWEGTGDGQALALRAGAALGDMEFVQFHPTGMVWPLSVRGILVTEAVRGEGGVLLNSQGERFMSRYDAERMELSTRDVVARAIYTEVKEGRGSPHGGVFLNISHKPEAFVRRKLPSMYAQFLEFAGVDITKEPMEVYPTTHYAMGGIKADAETCATNVRGLYAAGEAASGLHGANRLGGNSLSDLLVFGRRAGEAAGAYARSHPPVRIADEDVARLEAALRAPFEAKGVPAATILDELGTLMMEDAGVFRSAERLQRGFERLESLRRRAGSVQAKGSPRFNPGFDAALAVSGMIDLSIAIVRSAILRTESRGAHTRIDFPARDPDLQKVNSVTTSGSDGMPEVRFVVRPAMPDELAQILPNMNK